MVHSGGHRNYAASVDPPATRQKLVESAIVGGPEESHVSVLRSGLGYSCMAACKASHGPSHECS